MKVISFTFLIICFFAGCGKGQDHKGKTPLVEIDGEFLYREDLQNVLPPNLSKDDSLLFAENYIKNWGEDVLLFEKAEDNIPDNDKIEFLVENYRRTLIMHIYQQELMKQKLAGEITEKEIAQYYDQNKNLFLLDRPLIKGLFIKVPLKAPELNNVRVWYKKNSPEAIDKLEKYSLRNAVGYDYFYDRWMPSMEIIDKIPLKVEDVESYIEKNRNIEIKDSAYYYFLHVDEYLAVGQQKPLEFAQAEIKDILMNLKRVDFMQKMKNDLYKEAVQKNKIIYYY